MKLAGLPVNPIHLPLYFVQGKWTRLVTPRLPDASGPKTGHISGEAPALRLLVLGDSTVAGVGASTHQSGLTGQIAAHLAHQTRRAVQWQAIGQTSATTTIIRHQLAPRIAPKSADVVVLSCGVNDVTRLHTPEQWEANLRKLVHGLHKQLGAVPVIHAGVPPLDVFPALPQPLRGWLGMRAATFADIARHVFKDLELGSYSALPTDTTAMGFAPDGYHPNEKAYQLWGGHVANHCLPLIEAQKAKVAPLKPIADDKQRTWHITE